MGPGGERREVPISKKTNDDNQDSFEFVVGTKNTQELTDAYQSRTLVVNIFGADVAHHLGSHGLKGDDIFIFFKF